MTRLLCLACVCTIMLLHGMGFADDRRAGHPALRLASVARIWDEAEHNGFPDLIRYRDQWVCSLREAPAHRGGVTGSRVRILVSTDGEQWRSVATLSDPRGDIRTGKLAVTPDDRLMVLTAIQLHEPASHKHQSLTFFTSDLRNWEGPYDVGEPDYWMWGITWHAGVGYTIAYRTTTDEYVGRLYTTRDGRSFDVLVEELEPRGANESSIAFVGETAYCLLRATTSRAGLDREQIRRRRQAQPAYPNVPAYLGVATPPYTDWTWTATNEPVGGPKLILASSGDLLAGGRLYRPGPAWTMSLWWVTPQDAALVEALHLPSAGDTSYPGMVWHEGDLYVSYYSSHEDKTAIYFARITTTEPPRN